MDQIYQEELMEIFKNPAHKGLISDANAQTSERNPSCGDNISLQLKIANGIVEKAAFDGSSCAVSTISAEKLLSYIEGKSVKEVKALRQEDLLQILGITVSMTRIKCATLVLTGLKRALDNYESK